MSFLSRTITTSILEWRGLLIQITFERRRCVDHLQVETLEPQRAPLPITETGYRSHFVSKGIITDNGGPETFVQSWLETTATSRSWIEQEVAIRQYALF